MGSSLVNTHKPLLKSAFRGLRVFFASNSTESDAYRHPIIGRHMVDVVVVDV